MVLGAHRSEADQCSVWRQPVSHRRARRTMVEAVSDEKRNMESNFKPHPNVAKPTLLRLRGGNEFRKIEGKTKLASHLFFLDQFRAISHSHRNWELNAAVP